MDENETSDDSPWVEGFPAEPGYYWFCTIDTRARIAVTVRYGRARGPMKGANKRLMFTADGHILFPEEFKAHRICYHMPANPPPAPPKVEIPEEPRNA